MTIDKKNREHEVRADVRAHYGELAESGAACGEGGCCGAAPIEDLGAMARQIGYTDDDVARLDTDSTMSWGCGNPLALASLRTGETVLDLGSGAGFDSLLAADRVGPEGRVIGVDMTPAMLARARQAAADRPNVEFRLGEIEHLPVADASVDVVLSNCVINLSPEKGSVFAEAYRVLRPGGRLAVSDTVALKDLADSPFGGAEFLSACISGSVQVNELERLLDAAGFTDVQVVINEGARKAIADWAPGRKLEEWIGSAQISARRPR